MTLSKQPFSTLTPGIGGTLKYRYTDFIVQEITPEKEVCEIKRFLSENAIENASPIDPPQTPDDRKYSHLHCELEKYNADMPLVFKILSGQLRISKKRIGFAGLKDKRAVTSQKISIFNPDLEQLKRFRSRVVDLRKFEWKTDRIEIGDLTGNRFTITIRNLELEKKEIENSINDFFSQATQTGVANYFGEQRFGGIRNNTHKVGQLLLADKTEEAILLYLTQETDREPPELTSIRHTLAENRDYYQALKAFPNKFRFERAICQHLHNNPHDFAGALQKLPKNMRYLFTHAVQSDLFNQHLAKRLESGLGLAPIDGDDLEDGTPTLPLIGFETKLTETAMGKLGQEVLAENGLSTTHFRSKTIPEISSRGSARKIAIKPYDFELVEISDDEYYPEKQKATLRFSLEKGSYATTVLAELMKKNPTGSLLP